MLVKDIVAIYQTGLMLSHEEGLRMVYEAGLKGEVIVETAVVTNGWKGNTVYAVGDVIASVKNGKDTFYGCKTAGTSGNFEPTWTAKTTHDGSVLWAPL